MAVHFWRIRKDGGLARPSDEQLRAEGKLPGGEGNPKATAFPRGSNKAYDLMAHQMKISNINFYTDFDAGSDIIDCRENQIKQACIAILVNASEAVTENGEVLMHSFNPNNESITFEIIDNGVGISKEDMPHIFEPFFSAKQRASGIGLGLAIVHGIVQNHKGKIEVDSEPGKKTSISITLPLAKNKEA